MTYRDLKSNFDGVQSVQPQIVTAGIINGADVDLRGYDSACAIVSIGAIVTSGLVTAKLQESDAGGGSGYTDVVAADLQGAFTTLLTATTQRVGYAGAKRFVRLVITYVSGTSVAIAGNIDRSRASNLPMA